MSALFCLVLNRIQFLIAFHAIDSIHFRSFDRAPHSTAFTEIAKFAHGNSGRAFAKRAPASLMNFAAFHSLARPPFAIQSMDVNHTQHTACKCTSYIYYADITRRRQPREITYICIIYRLFCLNSGYAHE